MALALLGFFAQFLYFKHIFVIISVATTIVCMIMVRQIKGLVSTALNSCAYNPMHGSMKDTLNYLHIWSHLPF